MSRIVCFIDKEGCVGTCSEEANGKDTIGCRKCSFRKKFKDKEEEFSYCKWKGEIS
jgi:hypothetical protein